MTGIIEPADPNTPGGVHEGTREAADQAHPSIIPSVAEHARAGVGTAAKIFLAMAGLVVVLAMSFVLWRVIFRPLSLETAKAPPPAVAGSSGSVKRFDPTPPVPTEAGGSAAEDENLPAVPRIEVVGKRDPIGVRGTDPTGRGAVAASMADAASGAPRKLSEDAHVPLPRPSGGGFAAASGSAGAGTEGGTADPLAETRANLAEYRRQLGKSLDTLQSMIPGGAGQAGVRPGSAMTAGAPASGTTALAPASTCSGGGGRSVLGMQASDTPPARAGVLGNRSLVLPQGTSLTCALTTRVVSAQAGFIGCQVLRNVYSSDGRVLLIERGSHLDGEYRVTQVRPGSTRIPALWTRLRTPGGVTIDLDSPATGPLGESGADAYVDNRWLERVGAAMLVSILDDSIKIVLNNETAPQQGSNALVFQGTSQTASQMAEKVLDATINLPPLMYANQGSLVGVYVARDIDFSSVYELQPAAE